MPLWIGCSVDLLSHLCFLLVQEKIFACGLNRILHVGRRLARTQGSAKIVIFTCGCLCRPHSKIKIRKKIKLQKIKTLESAAASTPPASLRPHCHRRPSPLPDLGREGIGGEGSRIPRLHRRHVEEAAPCHFCRAPTPTPSVPSWGEERRERERGGGGVRERGDWGEVLCAAWRKRDRGEGRGEKEGKF